MQLAKQLAIFLENQPGMLASVCEALAKEKINIHALTTSDTVDHSVIRMIVSDTHKALLLFEERGTLVVEDDVILMEEANKPGTLGKIARTLADADVNIEYCYCASAPGSKKGLLVIRVSDVKKAMKVLNTTK